jgi:DNA-binding IclR family transcriptional regulator
LDDAEPAAEASNGAPTRTLEKGLVLLGLFDVDNPEWTLRQLRERTGFTKATTRRLMKTLEASNWVEWDPDTGKYHLGSRVLRALFLATSYSELARMAHPFLQKLAEETTESSSLCVWVDEGALIIDTVVTSRLFTPRTFAGMLMPGLASADAQILVAFGPEEQWNRLLAAPIERRTSKTVVDPDLLREKWREVRRAGIAFDYGEWKEEAPAVAAPVFDRTGRLRASLSVVAPIERGSKAEMERHAAVVENIAAELSKELGFEGSRS